MPPGRFLRLLQEIGMESEAQLANAGVDKYRAVLLPSCTAEQLSYSGCLG